jgi:hypothetical protein
LRMQLGMPLPYLNGYAHHIIIRLTIGSASTAWATMPTMNLMLPAMVVAQLTSWRKIRGFIVHAEQKDLNQPIQVASFVTVWPSLLPHSFPLPSCIAFDILPLRDSHFALDF